MLYITLRNVLVICHLLLCNLSSAYIIYSYCVIAVTTHFQCCGDKLVSIGDVLIYASVMFRGFLHINSYLCSSCVFYCRSRYVYLCCCFLVSDDNVFHKTCVSGCKLILIISRMYCKPGSKHYLRQRTNYLELCISLAETGCNTIVILLPHLIQCYHIERYCTMLVLYTLYSL